MSERRRVWLLNFDADDELGGQGASRTTASAAMRARLAELAARVSELTGSDEIAELSGKIRHDGSIGHAWSPTPSALRALAAIGARLPSSPPSFDVLRRANHRRLSAELGQTVPDAVFVDDAASASDHLSRRSPTGSWVAKRAFSYAGRGRIFVRRERGVGEHEAWIRASFADPVTAGLQIEPWLLRLADFALHGFVAPNGIVTLGHPTAQVCDDRGVWSGSTRTHGLSAVEEASLTCEAERAADALRSIGYHGPFGIDAFRFSTDASVSSFAARIEINARYTMGWAVGMAGRRVDLSDKA